MSLLLLFLVAVGLLMGYQKVAERFDNPQIVPVAKMSPALANLLSDASVTEKDNEKNPINVDTLARDMDVQKQTKHVCPTCPVCDKTPDPSKYIKIDEIPCWNCDVAGTITTH